ncbi:hypothetical protein SAMN06295912_11558 [Sphingomonas laterariae]|uniref:Uncharacterized protein n=1 Tax=Edaphosphingomonas laterariae TaxID=861865 RepID=A0A239H6S9_9SPHN|nr:hypothetical protein [Sphingomonas laterariae]SNS77136.1 hypothetical protein SAMN06295912_11558 [Sphingomonas laterariae]
MEGPEAMREEADRARRIAARSHNEGLIKTLSDYADELERRIAQWHAGAEAARL